MGSTSDGNATRVAHAIPADAAKMKAVVQGGYGPPEALGYTDVDTPVMGESDVLVRVRAASVHPGDYFVLTGVPHAATAALLVPAVLGS